MAQTNKPRLYESLQGKKRVFLVAFSETASIQRAAELAGVTRAAHYEWLNHDTDEVYKQAFLEAKELATQALESEMIRRAIEGNDRPVFHKGKLIARYKEYSDTLLIFALKAQRPNVYRDNYNVQVSGPEGAPLIPVAAVDQILEAARKERDAAKQ